MSKRPTSAVRAAGEAGATGAVPTGNEKVASKPFSFAELLSLVWFVIDAQTHLTIELGYVWLALTETAAKSDTFLGHIWREYSRADARWAVRDPTVISIEIATVLVGLLCAVQVYGVYKRTAWRHPLQIIICTAELYGGWMTFAPEWLDGSPNLDGSSFSLFWIYLVFMNGLWVVLPLLLLWDSFARLSHQVSSSMGPYSVDSASPKGAPSKYWFYVAASIIAVYMILVPAVLFTAKGVPIKP